MRAELIYTCEECGAEFARKNRPASVSWPRPTGRGGSWCCLPKSNITLEETYQLGSWNKADGWIIDEWLDWEDANVTHWMPLPDPPKEEHT